MTSHYRRQQRQAAENEANARMQKEINEPIRVRNPEARAANAPFHAEMDRLAAEDTKAMDAEFEAWKKAENEKNKTPIQKVGAKVKDFMEKTADAMATYASGVEASKPKQGTPERVMHDIIERTTGRGGM